MISVTRSAKPAILVTNETLWTNALCRKRADWYRAKAAFQNGSGPDPGEKPRAESNHYAHQQVKDALGHHTMFGPKCAYCEGEVKATSYIHVDHFHPQSVYPALAYNWDNLLQACGRCNGTAHKGDKFPILPSGRSQTEDTINPCSRGTAPQPVLINPCQDDPTVHLTFRNARVVARTNRGKRSRDIYGLQREDLLDARRRHLRGIRIALTAYKSAHSRGDRTEAKQYRFALRALVSPSHPFAGMARAEVTLKGFDWTRL